MYTFIELSDKRHIVLRTVSQGDVKATQLHFHTPKEAEEEFDAYIKRCEAKQLDLRKFESRAYMIVH